MDTIELIKQRISTNKFDTSRTLSEAEVKELVSYATEAPSALQHSELAIHGGHDPGGKSAVEIGGVQPAEGGRRGGDLHRAGRPARLRETASNFEADG